MNYIEQVIKRNYGFFWQGVAVGTIFWGIYWLIVGMIL